MVANLAPIRKAVIPAAGFGTRLFPASKAVKKALFPIVDRHGLAKPVLMTLVEEAFSAGIETVAVVVQPDDLPVFEEFFHAAPQGEYRAKLLPKYETEVNSLQEMGERITFVTQPTQEGFGHAVFCAKDWVDNEPFLVILGDHVYLSDLNISCAAQVLNIFAETGISVLGIESTPLHTITVRGGLTGTWEKSGQTGQASNRLLRLTQLVEKPTVEYAQQHLHVDGMLPDQLLALSGMYALQPQIFDYLADHIQRDRREYGEIQLTAALDRLRQDHGMLGYWVQGRSFDTGQPDYYLEAMIAFRQN